MAAESVAEPARWTGQEPDGGSPRRMGNPVEREWQRLDTLLGQGKTVAVGRPTGDPLRGSGLSGSDAYGQRLGGAGITRTRVNAGMTERNIGFKGSASAQELRKSDLMEKRLAGDRSGEIPSFKSSVLEGN